MPSHFFIVLLATLAATSVYCEQCVKHGGQCSGEATKRSLRSNKGPVNDNIKDTPPGTTDADWISQGLQIFPSAALSSEHSGAGGAGGTGAAEAAGQLYEGFPPSNCGSCRFFVPGFRKSGSTSMYFWIAAHPLVRGVKLDAPLGKARGETFAFRSESPRHANIKRYFSYNSGAHTNTPTATNDNHANNANMNNSGSSNHRNAARSKGGDKSWISGDASQDILSSHNASRNAQRNILKVCGGGVRFVVLLRDPVERAKSLAAMRYRRRGHGYAQEHLSLNDDIRANIKEALGGHTLAWANLTGNKEAAFAMLGRYQFSEPKADYVADSLYDVRLALLLQRFSPSQVLIVFTEHLAEHGGRVLRQVYRFLGLDPNMVNVSGVTAVAHNAADREERTHPQQDQHPDHLGGGVADRRMLPAPRRLPLPLPTALHKHPGQFMSASAAAELCEVLRPHLRVLKQQLGGIDFPWKTCNVY
tara:strand:- start:4215 stop:5636 length:1422 start_codon:yes stop_codon:yes gene_type:complete